MTNEEYAEQIQPIINNLIKQRQEMGNIAKEIIGHNLFIEDLFFCTSADRCTGLIDGFINMLEQRNLTCVGALLRLQMDNCLRTYAAFIAQDKKAVVHCIIDGEQINKQKDNQGKFLSDGHLKDRITKEIDPQFRQVYDQASGYIHLSSKAFYQMIDEIKDNSINFQVGLALPEKRNPVLIEAANAFFHFVKLHQKLLFAVVESKRRTDAELENTGN